MKFAKLLAILVSAFAVCSTLQAHQGVEHSGEKKECCGKDGKCCKDKKEILAHKSKKKECCGKDGKCCNCLL